MEPRIDWVHLTSRWPVPWKGKGLREWLSWLAEKGFPLDEEGFRAEARLLGSVFAMWDEWSGRLEIEREDEGQFIQCLHALWYYLLPEELAPEVLVQKAWIGICATTEGKVQEGLRVAYEGTMALAEMAQKRAPRGALEWIEELALREELPELLGAIGPLPEALEKHGLDEEGDALLRMWVKLVAIEPGQTKPSANALCPCGSGRKYKRCCGRETGKAR